MGSFNNTDIKQLISGHIIASGIESLPFPFNIWLISIFVNVQKIVVDHSICKAHC